MMPNTSILVFVLLAAASVSAYAAAPSGRLGRELLQSGVTCANDIPYCTARRCTTRILGSKETYVCLRCQPTFVPARGIDGRSIVQCGEFTSTSMYCFNRCHTQQLLSSAKFCMYVLLRRVAARHRSSSLKRIRLCTYALKQPLCECCLIQSVAACSACSLPCWNSTQHRLRQVREVLYRQLLPRRQHKRQDKER